MDMKFIDIAQGNRLLSAFESASGERLGPHIERVERKLGDVVCEAGGYLNHVYFPDGAVLSLLTVLENGAAIETANIGREGAFGLAQRCPNIAAPHSIEVSCKWRGACCGFRPSFCERNSRTAPTFVIFSSIIRALAGADSANRRLQCAAYGPAEDFPVAPHDE